MAMFAGQGVGSVASIEPASDVVASLSDGAAALLAGIRREGDAVDLRARSEVAS
jgi:hypothetical protein